MADLAELAHDLTTYMTRAALCRDMGEYGLAEHFERKAAVAQDAIEHLDAARLANERAIVTECGVS